MQSNNSLKLISVNIEGDNHIERVVNFIRNEQPDVVCFQEAFEKDMEFFAQTFQMYSTYAPSAKVRIDSGNRLTPKGNWGIGILSKYPLDDIQKHYYAGSEHLIPDLVTNPNAVNRVLLSAAIKKNNSTYCIGTTHFTWSHDGETIPLQRDHVQKLLTLVRKYSELILCGDFNAPRGKEIFSILASQLKDNIPPEITTTIDQHLHKVPGLMYVVDGLFSSDVYVVTNVQVVDGISDHMAVIGDITTKS